MGKRETRVSRQEDGRTGLRSQRQALHFRRRGHLFRVVSGDQCSPIEHVTGK